MTIYSFSVPTVSTTSLFPPVPISAVSSLLQAKPTDATAAAAAASAIGGGAASCRVTVNEEPGVGNSQQSSSNELTARVLVLLECAVCTGVCMYRIVEVGCS